MQSILLSNVRPAPYCSYYKILTPLPNFIISKRNLEKQIQKNHSSSTLFFPFKDLLSSNESNCHLRFNAIFHWKSWRFPSQIDPQGRWRSHTISKTMTSFHYQFSRTSVETLNEQLLKPLRGQMCKILFGTLLKKFWRYLHFSNMWGC